MFADEDEGYAVRVLANLMRCRLRDVSETAKKPVYFGPPSLGRIPMMQIKVMKFIAATEETWVRESRIREALGNNPDVSKAVRNLWKKGSLRRRGAGGRLDPHEYSDKFLN